MLGSTLLDQPGLFCIVTVLVWKALKRHINVVLPHFGAQSTVLQFLGSLSRKVSQRLEFKLFLICALF